MTLEEAFEAIRDHYNGDFNKTLRWFYYENLLLGNIRPMEMIINGRTNKLIKFIENTLEENQR